MKTYRVCTMNCGPALGDTRSAAQRRAECEDCTTVTQPPLKQVLNGLLEHYLMQYPSARNDEDVLTVRQTLDNL